MTASASPETTSPYRGGHREDRFVTQDEFRLFKWLGTFSLAAVLSGVGLLYQQTADIRVEMRSLHNELLREMHRQHTEIREVMGTLRERVARVETRVDGTNP